MIQKITISSLLILLIIVNTLTFTIIQGYYELNKEAITKTFCVNKENPEMHCEGKCHLHKMMTQASEEENTNHYQNSTSFFAELSFIAGHFNVSFNTKIIDKEFTTPYFLSITDSHLQSINHPPELS